MKNFVFIVCLLFSILLVSSVYAVQPVSMVLSSNNIVIYTGDTQSVDLTIQNNQKFADKFSVTIWPSYWFGINVEPENYVFDIASNSAVKTKINFGVPINADEIISPFNVTVKSLNNEEVYTSQIINLRVIRKSPVYLPDNPKLDKYVINPDDTINIEIPVKNIINSPSGLYTLKTTISRSNGDVVARFDDTLNGMPGETTQTITHQYTFDKYAKDGTYVVDVVLKDRLDKTINTRSTTLAINAVPEITYKKSSSYGLMTQTVTITAKNEGNVPSSPFYVTESVPTFMKNFFYPQGQPTTEISGNMIIYSWFMPSLISGEERIIKYEINLWYVWSVGIFVIVLIIMAFIYVFSPKVVKKYMHTRGLTGEKEITIMIEAKNRTRHEIKDVIVRDFVPSIARVVEKFETLKPTIIRKNEGGTEIIWKFANLKPFEDRVLTYSIKPIMQIVGTLKLPKARIWYLDKNKKKKAALSKSIFVKAR